MRACSPPPSPPSASLLLRGDVHRDGIPIVHGMPGPPMPRAYSSSSLLRSSSSAASFMSNGSSKSQLKNERLKAMAAQANVLADEFNKRSHVRGHARQHTARARTQSTRARTGLGRGARRRV
jgi:hypothetical protein